LDELDGGAGPKVAVGGADNTLYVKGDINST